jgi:hypothetical protein
LSIVGHLHDGGSAVKFYLNDELVCTSESGYDPALQPKGAPSAVQLTSMTICELSKPVKKGDAVHIAADYDFKQHMGMMEDDGSLSTVMGIGTVYVAAV